MHGPVIVGNGGGVGIIVADVSNGAFQRANEVGDGFGLGLSSRFHIRDGFAVAGDGDVGTGLFHEAQFLGAVCLELSHREGLGGFFFRRVS